MRDECAVRCDNLNSRFKLLKSSSGGPCMFRRFIQNRLLLVSFCFVALLTPAMLAIPRSSSAADFTGREILSVTRIAHGGADYASLQYVTVKASGFVNAVAFGGMSANPLGGMAEVKLMITDYQDKQMR